MLCRGHLVQMIGTVPFPWASADAGSQVLHPRQLVFLRDRQRTFCFCLVFPALKFYSLVGEF